MLLDTSGLLALLDAGEPLHQKARGIINPRVSVSRSTRSQRSLRAADFERSDTVSKSVVIRSQADIGTTACGHLSAGCVTCGTRPNARRCVAADALCELSFIASVVNTSALATFRITLVVGATSAIYSTHQT